MPRRANPNPDEASVLTGPGLSAPAVNARYEDAVAELEGIVAQLEAGRMPLDELLAAYQRGAALLTHCQGLLAQVEDQIRVLDENGIARRWSASAEGGDFLAASSAPPAKSP